MFLFYVKNNFFWAQQNLGGAAPNLPVATDVPARTSLHLPRDVL